ncbi:MAG: 6-phosphofructokinase [Victivallales bacterium]|nr:6-phosphofructokinase [Victivallales bacterium]MCF7888620.1 6-phosphofructokinase [Victivallales bacterium]
MAKYVGILTAGGDSPGLNAAIRGIGKAALNKYNMDIVGFKDGFRGLVQNKIIPLESRQLSGILTLGGTILGTSRDKPHKMPIGSKVLDMTDVIVENYHKNHLDVLVCLGGGGTQKNAYRLMERGLNIITLPKTIDNDVAMTDVTFGFDTALGIATEAIDKLHSTASSHHRILVLEIMGHNAGWLALGAGISGGADVILLPEIPYNIETVADAICKRSRGGKHFSIVAVSEGAIPKKVAEELKKAENAKQNAKNKDEKKKASKEIKKIREKLSNHTMWVSEQLQKLCKIESRVTILGHLQRGGTPSAGDRLLATRLGTTAAKLIKNEEFGVMVASKGDKAEPVPLDKVVGKKKLVPIDHPWIRCAKEVGTCLGD